MLSRADFLFKNIVLVYATEKERLSFKNDNLIVKDENDKIILQKTCYRIFSVWIVGPCTISSGLIEKSKKFGFSIFIFNYSFRLINTINVKTEGNVLLRKKQYEYNKIDIAQHLVYNKMVNQLALLKSIRKKTPSCKDNIANIERMMNIDLPQQNELQKIMGLEGMASKVFFSEWFYNMNWKGRKPRAKSDELNVLMDIGYTLLFNYIEAMLNLYGFDTYCGVYHRFFYQRKSLVCDLVEPFRCIIDRKIKNAYNLKQIKASDFQYSKGKCILPYKNSKPYVKFLIESILEEKEEIFLFIQKYYRAFINDKPISEYPIYKIIK